MIIEHPDELAALRRVGKVVSAVLRLMLASVEAGMTTNDLDAIGEAALRRRGARSAPRLAYHFPGATCISVNEETAHGIPGSRVIRRGDVVNIDVSAEMEGYYADTGATLVVPPAANRNARLCAASREALAAALSVATHGAPLRAIGCAIAAVANQRGFRAVENLGSHGIGRRLHEAPGFIAGYAVPKDHRRLREGMVITIEPFLSTRSRRLRLAADGWTLRGMPGNRSAQYEHTLVITRAAPLLLTHGAF